MKRTRVKVCGLTRLEDAELAVDLGADAVGFIFWPKSPRVVGVDRAAAIARALPAFVARVGVFVNPEPDEVKRIADEVGLSAAQLHGDESPARFGGTAPALIKVAALAGDRDVRSAIEMPLDVTVLIDAVDRERRGGTGVQADWAGAARVAAIRPVILAGGLSAENVAQAIHAVRPWAIDVSSGVEDRPGVKSAARLRALFDAIREETHA